MRAINSLSDAEIVLRDLHNQLDLLRSENIDMNKRRVVNATPSRDLYDYVVRKELEDVAKSIKESPELVKSPSFYTVVFANSGTITRGSPYATSPYIIKFPGKPIQISIACLVPPVLEGLTVVVKWMGLNIIDGPGYLEYPAGTPGGTVINYTAIKDGTYFDKDTWIVLEVLTTGSAGKVTVQVVVEEN